ncbi:16S rRNA (cytidine(1402)-2'-O)-methyltransferase [Paraliomyxa miuraensis]|uniref:16S rRNA (cytidine(1402)-2'-O)-methyltransferase n=1 Tax=Paraliomyxa miuraensis TaxID=376150 RepID=UPI00225A4D7A|nr:16S rRNA (cytidine(1402)-2'-O)-methyltransferase [Paraliomyxa miuraensis]MCX4246244.1 16S rRNA (cytidine(1402)-2'-O)-methyltransferase [Paraliomyxa miuraensis]
MLGPAVLYLVATPIGNLEDVSLRALEILRTVDFVASEDTRHTAKLLARHQIKARQMPFHEHNESRVVGKIVTLLHEGRDIALVSDAGTPGIADPGFSLVRRCHEEGLAVTMIPGPAAFVMAVVLSGLPLHAFTFRGFPPRKSGKRKRFLAVDVASPHTLVFYESPYRVKQLVEDALEVYGDRRAALCNDLTKKFEAVHRGTLSELARRLEEEGARGEYVLVIEGTGGGAGERDDDDPPEPLGPPR